jgi:DNA-binding SARP family transcriptional activator
MEGGDGTHLLAQGLARAIEGRHADAAACLALAREHLAATQQPIIAALDDYLASHARYSQAQHDLHSASLYFAAVYAEQQARLAALQHLAASLAAASAKAPTLALEVGRSYPAPASDVQQLPRLTITCFGRFSVRRSGELLRLCPNRNGQAILRYLATRPYYRATIDEILEVLWPEDPPAVARHKLHVAVSALRRSLSEGCAGMKGGGHIVCDQEIYQLQPAEAISTDVAAFVANYRAGQGATGDAALRHYEAACALYAGEFLAEDRYADWSLIQREQLTQMYLTMCRALGGRALDDGRLDDALHWSAILLAENRCDEAACRQIMRAHAAVGRRAEALQQYQRCAQSLEAELGISPSPETTALHAAIQRGAPLPPEGPA